MIIRLVEPQDHAQWHALRSALWPDCTAERHASEMHEYASRGGRFATFVACLRENELCGFLEASLREFAEGCDSSPVGYIEGIYVRPDARLYGIGRALTAAAEQWARENGAVEAGLGLPRRQRRQPGVSSPRRLRDLRAHDLFSEIATARTGLKKRGPGPAGRPISPRIAIGANAQRRFHHLGTLLSRGGNRADAKSSDLHGRRVKPPRL